MTLLRNSFQNLTNYYSLNHCSAVDLSTLSKQLTISNFGCEILKKSKRETT